MKVLQRKIALMVPCCWSLMKAEEFLDIDVTLKSSLEDLKKAASFKELLYVVRQNNEYFKILWLQGNKRPLTSSRKTQMMGSLPIHSCVYCTTKLRRCEIRHHSCTYPHHTSDIRGDKAHLREAQSPLIMTPLRWSQLWWLGCHLYVQLTADKLVATFPGR